MALRAWYLGHVGFDLPLHVIRLGFTVPSLKIADYALKRGVKFTAPIVALILYVQLAFPRSI